MAIRLVTGLPGSGKTYYCVNHIVKDYCTSFGDSFELKDNIILITNINQLTLGLHSLDDLIAKAGSIKKFFTMEHQQKVIDHFEGKSIVYVIDEAQKYFDRKFYDRGVFGFFETHRHLGLDIWLVSQNSNLLARDVLSLAEFEIRATPRTLSIMGFTYVKKTQGQIIGKEVLKKKKIIFSLYTSQVGEETEKIRSPYLKYCFGFCFCLFLGYVMYQFTFASWGSENKKAISNISKDVGVVGIQEKHVKGTTDIVLRRINFVLCDGVLMLYDWSVGQFVPERSFTFPIILDRSSSRLVLYAEVPVIDEEDS